MSYLFTFSYCSWGSQGKNNEVVCHSLLQWTAFCQSSLSTMTRPSWVPHTAWLSFTELDKAVVHVIRLASCLWLLFQSVCPLMPSLSAYHLTGVSFTLDVGYLLTATATDLGREVSPLSHLLLPFLTLVKFCYTKALEWSSLVPGPEAKSSSSEIMNPTLFTINYQMLGKQGGSTPVMMHESSQKSKRCVWTQPDHPWSLTESLRNCLAKKCLRRVDK